MTNIVIPNAVTSLDPNLRRIYGCFGYDESLLIPVSDGKATIQRPDQVTLQASHAAAYQNRLIGSAIAVVCGPVSHNLGCISVETEQLDAFLCKNVFLQDTLQVRFKNSHHFFVRVEGEYPPTMQGRAVGWFCKEPVIVYTPERNSGYIFVNEARPTTITFDQIVWLADLAWGFQLQRLESRTPPTMSTPKGTKLNDDYVVELFRIHHDVGFDPVTKRFYNDTEILWHEMIQQKLRELLKTLQSRFTGLVIDTGAANLKRITKLLEICYAAPLPGSATSIDRFVADRLERCPGSDVTGSELYGAYQTYCNESKTAGFSEGEFHKRIEASITAHFGISKSNDIARDGGCRRGFHNLHLRTARTARTARTGEIYGDEQVSKNIVRVFV